MPENCATRWEREFHEQAVESELYLAGQRAGAALARTEWPKVERARPQVRNKSDLAATKIFGHRRAAAGSVGYRVGWIEGYDACCARLDRLEAAAERTRGGGPHAS
jgi:hypothetical protein